MTTFKMTKLLKTATITALITGFANSAGALDFTNPVHAEIAGIELFAPLDWLTTLKICNWVVSLDGGIVERSSIHGRLRVGLGYRAEKEYRKERKKAQRLQQLACISIG